MNRSHVRTVGDVLCALVFFCWGMMFPRLNHLSAVQTAGAERGLIAMILITAGLYLGLFVWYLRQSR